jgi:hypothetical protein
MGLATSRSLHQNDTSRPCAEDDSPDVQVVIDQSLYLYLQRAAHLQLTIATVNGSAYFTLGNLNDAVDLPVFSGKATSLVS